MQLDLMRTEWREGLQSDAGTQREEDGFLIKYLASLPFTNFDSDCLDSTYLLFACLERSSSRARFKLVRESMFASCECE
jgi:hypothetical protein